jgi:hypothetical protein
MSDVKVGDTVFEIPFGKGLKKGPKMTVEQILQNDKARCSFLDDDKKLCEKIVDLSKIVKN